MNLTAIRNAQPGTILKDDQVRGLELHKREDGGSWMLYYRTKSGQRRRPKIAGYPALTLQQAREIAREWLGEVARGKDPSKENQALRGAPTVSDVADAWLATRTTKKAFRHDKGRVNYIIKPRLGSAKIRDVTKADILAMKKAMSDRPVSFNRAMAAINGIWKFAELEPPTKGVDAYPERARRRYLSEAEVKRLNAALDEVEPQYPYQIALIRVLMLTGARISEIRTARRDQYRDKVLDLRIHKTDDKMGGRVIAFSDAADEIVQATKPRKGWLLGFNSYPNAAWDLVREKAALVDFTIHDLRHSFASTAISEGFNLDEIGEVLGHTDAATTKRYAHLNEERQRKIAEAVAKRR